MRNPQHWCAAKSQIQLQELLNAYQPPELPSEQVTELRAMVEGLAKEAGMDKLPEFKR